MSYRIIQINELIKKELQSILHNDFPGEIIEINFVNTSKDLSHADIYVSVFSDRKSVYKSIKNNTGKYWKLLSNRVVLRKLPKLNFIEDKMRDQINKIDEIISNQL